MSVYDRVSGVEEKRNSKDVYRVSAYLFLRLMFSGLNTS